MKKFMVLLMVLALVTSMFVGCGDETTDTKTDDETKNEATTEDSQSEDKNESTEATEPNVEEKKLEGKVTLMVKQSFNTDDAMVKTVKEPFEAMYPGVEVELIFADNDNYDDKIVTMFAGGQSPDVFNIDGGLLMTYVNRDVLLPINDYIATDNYDLSNYSQAVMDDVYNLGDGIIYALPSIVFSRGLFVNKKIFNTYGVEVPQAGTTLEAILAKGYELDEKIKAAGDYEKGVRPFSVLADDEILRDIAGAYGEYFYDAESYTMTVGSEVWDKTFDFVHQIYTNGLIMTKTEATVKGYPAPHKMFAQGLTAMEFEGTWLTKGIINNLPDDGSISIDDFDVIPLPVFEGGPDMYGPLDYTAYGISKETENPDVAFELLKFMAKDYLDNMTDFSGEVNVYARNDLKGSTIIEGNYPGIRDVLDKEVYEAFDLLPQDRTFRKNVMNAVLAELAVSDMSLDEFKTNILEQGQDALDDYKIDNE